MQIREKQAIHHQSPSQLKNPPGKDLFIQLKLSMNISGSECSSGCESGWTRYLDQFSNSTYPHSRGYEEGKGEYAYEDQEDDEDLSMVSDASSGPPHFQEYQNCAYEDQCYGYSSVPEQKKINKQKSRAKETRAKKQQSLSIDDDTASSPICHFSQGNVTQPGNHRPKEQVSSFSQVYSAAQFEGESITKKQLGFFKTSSKGKSGSLLGRKRH